MCKSNKINTSMLLTLVVTLVSISLYTITANASTSQVANALFKGVSTNYDYNTWGVSSSSTCGYIGGHTGIDIQTTYGADPSRNAIFYSLTRGIVKKTYASGANGICVYDKNNPNPITAIYLHASEIFVAENQYVDVGTALGRQGCVGYCTGAHVHFEVRKGEQTSAACNFSDTVDPVATAMSYMSMSIIPLSYIDGAGSLVAPEYSGYGGSKDIVILHPHGTYNSTGLFQVLYKVNYCQSVTLDGLKSAYISVKEWSEQFPGQNKDSRSTIYKATSLPVNIPLIQGKWHTISVTTTAPVPEGDSRELTLTCSPNTVSSLPSNLQKIAPSSSEITGNEDIVLTPFPDDYYWSGNGSVISNISTDHNTCITEDVAITLNDSKKSLILFQIFPTNSCNKIKISSNLSNLNANISWKKWYVNDVSSDWRTGRDMVLPCTLTLTTGDYWIIKVKPDNVNLGTGQYIYAECVQ
ncbi:MAG: M23 family metallopeptidase [Desulfobacterales bacterium]|nr:M23 family metallopeptidase [Desulfobacterales bacterium]